MSDDNSRYIPRPPRHPVSTEHRLVVTVQNVAADSCSHASGADSAVAIELINLSRSGAQFRSSIILANGDRIVFHFSDPNSDFQLSQEAVVRWQQSEGDQTRLTGCRFVEELSWEALGELFLSDVLSCDIVSP